MTLQDRTDIKSLLPDLQPMDHVPLNTKRTNFIYGQGIIIYDEIYAVEIYLPRNNKEEITFFAVDRHFGHINKLGEYYRKMNVLSIDHHAVTAEMKEQFSLAVSFNMEGMANVNEMYVGLNRAAA